MAKENEFPVWLRSALGGRPNVFLVRNSGKKDNGRPVIDDSRVSKWLKGDQRPSMELAVLAARVLGKPPSEALRAAGHTYGLSLERLESIDREYPAPNSVGGGSNDEPEFEFLTRVREDLTDEEMDQLMKEATPYLQMLMRDIKARRG